MPLCKHDFLDGTYPNQPKACRLLPHMRLQPQALSSVVSCCTALYCQAAHKLLPKRHVRWEAPWTMPVYLCCFVFCVKLGCNQICRLLQQLLPQPRLELCCCSCFRLHLLQQRIATWRSKGWLELLPLPIINHINASFTINHINTTMPAPSCVDTRYSISCMAKYSTSCMEQVAEKLPSSPVQAACWLR